MKKQSSSGKSGKIRILIVDDHPIFIEGLKLLLEGEDQFELAGVARTRAEVLEKIVVKRPDVVLVDLALHGEDGMEVVKDVVRLYHGIKVVVLSIVDDAIFAEHALKAGVHAFIMKHEAAETLFVAIRHVLDGSLYLNAGSPATKGSAVHEPVHV